MKLRTDMWSSLEADITMKVTEQDLSISDLQKCVRGCAKALRKNHWVEPVAVKKESLIKLIVIEIV
jgi:uncharacterized Fe-S cluster protein YjdI